MEVTQSKLLTSYLTCPFCPAQAYPVPTDNMLKYGYGLQGYKCPARHVFYVEQEEDEC